MWEWMEWNIPRSLILILELCEFLVGIFEVFSGGVRGRNIEQVLFEKFLSWKIKDMLFFAHKISLDSIPVTAAFYVSRCDFGEFFLHFHFLMCRFLFRRVFYLLKIFLYVFFLILAFSAVAKYFFFSYLLLAILTKLFETQIRELNNNNYPPSATLSSNHVNTTHETVKQYRKCWIKLHGKKEKKFEVS